MTTTSLNNHVAVSLQYYIRAFVVVKDWKGVKFGWSTTRFWDITRIHEVDERLDYSMIRGIHVGMQRKRTISTAIMGVVTLGCYQPFL